MRGILTLRAGVQAVNFSHPSRRLGETEVLPNGTLFSPPRLHGIGFSTNGNLASTPGKKVLVLGEQNMR